MPGGEMRRASTAGDGGVTLRGLLVAVGTGIALIVTVIVVYTGVERMQAAAGDRRSAQQQLSVMGDSLTGSLSKASDARVRLDGHALVARIAVGDESHECRAWFVDDHGLHYTSGRDPIDLDSADSWPVIVPGALGALPGGGAFRQFAGVVRVSAGVEVGDVVIPFVSIASPPGTADAGQC